MHRPRPQVGDQGDRRIPQTNASATTLQVKVLCELPQGSEHPREVSPGRGQEGGLLDDSSLQRSVRNQSRSRFAQLDLSVRQGRGDGWGLDDETL